VAETQMRYRASAKFDDLIEVETWVGSATRASLWFDSIIRRGETLLVEARVRLACVSFVDAQIRRIPSVVLDACLEPGHGV
jgi:acyl-CoA thioester hydrolase